LAGALFESLADVDLLHVPYTGNQGALRDVPGGASANTFQSAAAGVAGYSSRQTSRTGRGRHDAIQAFASRADHRRSRSTRRRGAGLVWSCRTGEHAARDRRQGSCMRCVLQRQHKSCLVNCSSQALIPNCLRPESFQRLIADENSQMEADHRAERHSAGVTASGRTDRFADVIVAAYP
jgi:hypothetical protein